MGGHRAAHARAGDVWATPRDKPAGGSERHLLHRPDRIAQTGCQWRMLPGDFPPFTTVQRYFYGWQAEGRWRAINQALLMAVREAEGREASPTAGSCSTGTAVIATKSSVISLCFFASASCCRGRELPRIR